MGRLTVLLRRFAQAQAAERSQSFIRSAIVLAAVVLLFGIDPNAEIGGATPILLGRQLAVLSLAASVGFLLAILIRPAPSAHRRLLGIVHDVGAVSIAMALGGPAAAPYAGLYLLVALGNGFRYGTRYLYFAATLSIVAFAALYFVSAYWHTRGTLSLNVFITLAVVSFYVGRKLASLHDARDELEVRASRDALTGLLNRMEFESSVAEIMAREPTGHALLFCDLDRFKAVNDAAGHAAGDKLLADVGAIIAGCARPGDLCGRAGGDEFCLLLCRCSPETAREIADRIRRKVSGYRLAWANTYFAVEISIGVAPSSAVTDVSSLFRLADAACYAAKNSGRNRIHVIDPEADVVDTAQVRRLFIDTAGDVIVPPPLEHRAATRRSH